MPVGEQNGHRTGDHGQRREDHDGLGQHRPAEQRQAAPAHATGAHVGDRDGDVQRAEDRADPRQVDQEDPRVGAVARDVGPGGQRRIRRPPGLGWAEEHRRVEDEAAGEVQPVGERVQLREGHVPRADLERHDVVGEACPQRHDDEEHHRRAVHREHLVVRLRGQQRVVGRRELRAHEQRLDASDHHEGERRDQVQDADALVIGGRHPASPAGAALLLDAMGDELGAGNRGAEARGVARGHLLPHGRRGAAWW